MAGEGGTTRIQRANRAAILAAGLDAFAEDGFRGATLDRIAKGAGLSKPNLLYYFPSKEAVYRALLDGLLDDWLAPLRDLDPSGDPMEEMLAYVRAKLALSRARPRESRLFAGEVLRGAPVLGGGFGDLRALVEDRAAVIAGWMEAGRLAPSDPHHLVMSVWALTQHYADFEVQVRAVLGGGRDPWAEAEREVQAHFRRVLRPA
ncbi:TetR family transcriptional regulator C-terminal domain-containing protein [Jannaschia sp. Os4]|uniref:TetR family transcriptional regulator C-terminal domain-containing protein n=1 Tax=Jannaschia sp. Os4 TaxID=2807617 RepID=UPI001939B081|nr:TetR family transcriptional regulator C-terminal domain-containing protein [Jannaschia sp. Os4]MBM2577551.1 TetR family transcriptional regulator C-terminal domain-containing protein [Jannaschia sp. Os4]